MIFVTKKTVNVLVFLHAVLNLLVKWFSGVLIGKLIGAATQGGGLINGAGDGASFYEYILLTNVSFEETTVAATVAVVLNTLIVAAEKSFAVLRGSQTGHTLRSAALQQAIGDRGAATETDMSLVASDLVRKISLIEEFQKNEEPMVLYSQLRLFFSLVLVFVFLWYAGLAVFVMLLLGEFGGYLVEKKRAGFHRMLEKNAADVNDRLLDTVKNGVAVKANRMAEKETQVLSDLQNSSNKERMNDAKLRFVREIVKTAFIAMVPLLVPLFVWWNIAAIDSAEAIQLGIAALIALLLLDEGHKSVLALALMFDRQCQAEEAQETVDSFLRTGSENVVHSKLNADSSMDAECGVDRLDKAEPKRISLPDIQQIVLDDVVLCYPGRPTPVLNHVSKTFQRGRITGLIGESGAGKSTTIKVVGDLLAHDHGHVEHWEGMKIAYVSQEQKLFARTVRENVTYGTENMSDDKVWAALARAKIDSFVKALPLGLDEPLSGGEKMVSGGQLQRLHLAHLFCVWNDADLVLLDESLSALDKTSRESLIDELKDFLKGKTALIITHNSEELRLCDVVLDLTPPVERPLLTGLHPRTSRRRSSVFGSLAYVAE